MRRCVGMKMVTRRTYLALHVTVLYLQIRVLDLSLNKFSCLPAPVLEFVALTQLQLSQNALTELPELVVLKKLKQV